MKIAFILQSASHARYWRRIEKLQKEGATPSVLAFERNTYAGKKEEKNYTPLANIQQENYVKRLIPLLKSMGTIRKNLNHTDVIYAFGVDTFIIAWLASRLKGKKIKFVYEVGDIRKVFMGEGLMAKTFRFLERRILNRTDLLVVTSEAFVEEYFTKIQGQNTIKYHVIENKPELTEEKIQAKDTALEDGKITIGYFGVLRCRNSLEILKNIGKNHSEKFNIYIRGVAQGTEDLLEEINTLDNVVVEGEYKVPEDLYAMYAKIDVNWACYPYQGEKPGNWLWAKTTRFYESCFFRTPMVTQEQSQDALFTEKYGVGIAVSLKEMDQSAEKIGELGPEAIKKMQARFHDLPKETIKYQQEHKELIDQLSSKE